MKKWDAGLRGKNRLRTAVIEAEQTLSEYAELEAKGRHHSCGPSSRELLALRTVLYAAKRALKCLPEAQLLGPPIRTRHAKLVVLKVDR